ncbi:MAG: GAF domain-containing protein [Rubrobacteraceae bacterium]
MSSEDRSREEELVRAREEISHLKRRLADDRFAEDLRDALTLVAAAGAISSPLEHSRLLEMIVETAAGVLPSRSAALFLLDEEAEELVFEVALGPEADEVRKFRIPLGHGIAGLVAVSGQPMAVSDAAKDPRQAADVAESVGYAPESILCVPLVHEDEIIGVLELLDREGAPSFNASDMQALGLFANQAAVAIEQSRAQGNLSALLGGVLGSLGGMPDHRIESLREGVEPFVAGVEEGASHRRALELAELVREISHRGEEESKACHTILQGFAEYLRSRPRPEDEAGEMW